MADDGVMVTDEDWAEARAEAGTIARNAAVGGVGLVAVVYSVTGVLLRALLPQSSGMALVGIGTGVAALLSAPLLWLLARTAQAKGLEAGSVRVAHDRVMRVQAKRREFETRLARALEMVQDELAALDVVQRAMSHVAPQAPVELLRPMARASRAARSTRRTSVRRPVGPRPRCSATAKHSMRVRCCAADRRAAAPRCASPSR